MVFNFTFSFSVPGVSNPFSGATPAPAVTASTPPAQADSKNPLYARRRPHPATLPPSQPLSRKRGWVPSEAEPTQPAMSSASSTGYLDTPAKYRDFTVTPDPRFEDEVDEMVGDLPPAKRRRTFAGSIVSTAVSAALIGTAVGLTVYRLWRDRGKEPEAISAPPPPYEQGDWPQPQQQPRNDSLAVNAIPPTPRGKKPRAVPTSSRRTPHRHRRQRSQVPNTSAGPSAPSPGPSRSPVKPEFDFAAINPPVDEPDEIDETMDWMGSRLAQLIEEGKRALGKEVVVMSETAEDAEDDMSGDWEEEDVRARDGKSLSRSSSRRGSMRRKHHPQHIGLPSAYAGSPSGRSSPVALSYSHSTSPMLSPGFHNRSSSGDIHRTSPSYMGDASQWQSPAMQESMERARARYLQGRR